MSVIKTTAGQQQVDSRKCPNCKTILPPQAQFCGTCGRRVSHENQGANSPSPQIANNINERYRITSLIRRRPYVQLLMATDLPYQRPVIIRDIDISSLNKQAQALARQAVEEEYNQLRRQLIQGVMLLVDFHSIGDHIYTVAEWPATLIRREQQERPLYTLEDLLQSGIGLPNETEAVLWIERLAQTTAHLHSRHIILSDLDPYAISVSSDTYEGTPALMVSWLPQAIRKLLPPPPAKTYVRSFYAPETRKGEIRPQSDIYSLGAILYLLLTGTAPTSKTQAKKRVLRSPRELRGTVNPGLDAIVMGALADDPAERFESAQRFAETLRDLITSPAQPSGGHALINTVFKGKRDSIELPALRPSKPVSPYSTRVLPAVPPVPPVPPEASAPPVLPQTPQPVASPEPVMPLATGPDTTKTTDQAAQPPPAAAHEDSSSVNVVPADQGKHSLAIEDIETIIINASEFEAALAQATHHLLNPEDEELYTRLASEAPEAVPSHVETHNQPAIPDENAVEAQPADSDVIAQAPPSTQHEEQQNAPVSDNATTNIKMIEEQATMTLEEEIEPHVPIERSGEQEASIADIPTVSFKGPDPTALEAAPANSKQLEESENIPAVVDKQEPAAQATASSPAEEEKPTEQAELHSPLSSTAEIAEAKTQATPLAIEDIATQTFAEPVKLNIPAELEADEPTIEQASAPAAHVMEPPLAEPPHMDQPIQPPLADQPAQPHRADQPAPSPLPISPADNQGHQAITEKPVGRQIKRFFTSPIPTIPRLLPHRTSSGSAPLLKQPALDQVATNAEKLLRHLRHFVLGQQQHSTSAAALIETPLRIQPNQNYTIRIQIMGRDTPRQRGVGLSGLIRDEYVHIEVRSALYHKYAYIVQQADIRLPGQGFAAAVTIPMKPLSDGPSGRRERLHIYFMDEQRNLLYEKPFAIEIFISPLVQPGREGHNVLPIPL
jgi:serine/threonine protein kinase